MEVVAIYEINDLSTKGVWNYSVLVKEKSKLYIKKVSLEYRPIFMSPDNLSKYSIEDIDSDCPIYDYTNMMLDNLVDYLSGYYKSFQLSIDHTMLGANNKVKKGRIDLISDLIGAKEAEFAHVYPNWVIDDLYGPQQLIDTYLYVNTKKGYSDMHDLLENSREIIKKSSKTVVMLTHDYCMRMIKVNEEEAPNVLIVVQKV